MGKSPGHKNSIDYTVLADLLKQEPRSKSAGS